MSQIFSESVKLWGITILITPIFGTHIHGLHTLYHTPPCLLRNSQLDTVLVSYFVPPVLQGSSLSSNEINTKRGQVSRNSSTRVKAWTIIFTGTILPL